MFAHEGRAEQPPPPSAQSRYSVTICRILKKRTQLQPLGKLGKKAVKQFSKGVSGKLLTSREHPSLPPQAAILVHTPRTARFSLSRGHHHCLLVPSRRGGAERDQGARRAGQCLICFPLGWRVVTISTSFRPPRGKSRPNLTARLETNSLQICKGARVATSSWRAQTWCRLNNHTQAQGSTKLRGLAHHSSVQPRECTLQQGELPCARAHKCTPETLVKCLGVSCAVEGPSPAARLWERHLTGASPAWSWRQLRDKPETTVVTAPCGKGEEAQRSPQQCSLNAFPQNL